MAEGNGKVEPVDLDVLAADVRKHKVYGNRGLRKVLPIGDWLIELAMLPATVWAHCQSIEDDYRQAFEIVRFGIVGWTGLKDRDGADIPFESESVPIWEHPYKALKYELVDTIPPHVIGIIRRAIDLMSTLTLQEAEMLDFSLPPASTEDATAVPSETAADTTSVISVAAGTESQA